MDNATTKDEGQSPLLPLERNQRKDERHFLFFSHSNNYCPVSVNSRVTVVPSQPVKRRVRKGNQKMRMESHKDDEKMIFITFLFCCPVWTSLFPWIWKYRCNKETAIVTEKKGLTFEPMSLTGLLGKYLYISQLVIFLRRAREKSTHIFNAKTMALLV